MPCGYRNSARRPRFRDPRTIVQGRNALFRMFGGKVPLRPARVRAGEKPYLIARVGMDRAVLIEAAGSW